MCLMKKGSITVEAAFVLPVFLFGILGLLYIIQILSLQTSIQSALKDTANTASLYGYFNEEGKSSLGLQAAFELHMADKRVNKFCVQGGIISLLGSCYEGDDINIIADYRIRLPLPLLNLSSFRVTQSFKTRKFVGYDRREKGANSSLEGDKEKRDRYVYVAENGTVYHETKECSHLKLSIKETTRIQIMELRNEAGGRYKACNLCAKTEAVNNKTLFVTTDGNKYHLSAACTGLKRTIRKVLLSSVSSFKGCSRCS